ncbi:MAG: prepilin-type N-terminal cleavage/methylation domain-containing protein [Tissierellia bacterium]|nr:prepilin-type N-terminal cleavage/methylation domain-containing protein [Tissierellia bacterium]
MKKSWFMNPKGMTLIEVILAISILSIIAITFLPIITGSFSNIVKAGNKTRQVYDTKGKIEEAMANKQSIEMDDDTIIFESSRIPIKFNNMDPLYVEGGKVVKDGMLAFAVNTPTLSVEPYRLYEAGENRVVVEGKFITFLNNSEYVLNKEKISPYSTILKIENSNKLTLEGYNWKNENQPYIFKVKTDSKIAKAYILVLQPKVMVVGNGKIKISSDFNNNYTHWKDRNVNPQVNLNRVRYINSSLIGRGYIAVGDKGKILTLFENSGWESIGNNLTNKELMDIAYGNDMLVAVGTDGTIIYSDGKDSWTLGSIIDFDHDLNGVSFGEFEANEYFVAVGDKATWLYWNLEGQWEIIDWDQVESIDKAEIEKETFFDVETIKYKDSSDGEVTMFVAVGSNGTILTGSISENGGEKINFEYVMAGSTDLKAIASNGDIDNPVLIAVGDGIILKSDNSNNEIGIKWEVYKDNNLLFTDITYADGQFLAVGNKKSNNRGFITTSTDGKEWTEVFEIGDFTVKSVSGY